MANPIGVTLSTATLDGIVRAAIARDQPVPETGVAIAVVKDGAVIFKEGYGHRDRQNADPVRAETVFGLGSATKPFTAFAWSIWEEQEAVESYLDKSIVGYAPGFALRDANVTGKVTLRDLLSHHTGLPRHDVLWYLGGFPMPDLVHRLRHLAPDRLVRFGCGSYNNLLYTAAGWLLEQVSGERWQDLVQRRLLDPLEMTATTFTIDALRSTEFAVPYLKNQAMCPKDVTNIAPAAALNSNVIDVARFLQFVLSDGHLENGRPLLSAAGMERHFQPLTKIEWRGVEQHYGLGWFIAKVDEHIVVHHTGATDGYSTIVAMVPKAGIGICVLVNQHADLLPDRIAGAVIDALMGGGPFSARAFAGAPMIDPLGVGDLASALLDTVPVISDADDSYTGKYSDPGYGDMFISMVQGERFLRWEGQSWRLQRAFPWVLPFFRVRIEGYGRTQTVPIWIRNERDGGKSFSLPLEPEVEAIRFYRR